MLFAGADWQDSVQENPAGGVPETAKNPLRGQEEENSGQPAEEREARGALKEKGISTRKRNASSFLYYITGS